MPKVVHSDGYEGPDRRKFTGEALTYRWLVGILFTLLFMGGGAWMTSIHASVNGMSQTNAEQGERLASLESTVKSIDHRLGQIVTSMHRIEDRVGHEARQRTP